MTLLVLSGADQIRFPTIINHKIYADRHGYRYRFDASPSSDIGNIYFHKISKLRDALQDADWIFWIDDDAAFMQMDRTLESLVPELNDPDTHLIFCKSPVNPEGGWTHISSGNFLIRNSPLGREIVSRARDDLLPVVREWWNSETYGMFTNGDQDVLVYLIETQEHIKNATRILEYDRFNTRPYHFQQGTEHFLVHFTHRPNMGKADQMRAFASRFGLSPLLVRDEALAAYRLYADGLLRMSGV